MTLFPHQTSYEVSALEIFPDLFFSGEIKIGYADCENFSVEEIDGSLLHLDEENEWEEIIYLTDTKNPLFGQIVKGLTDWLTAHGDSLENIVRDADTHREG